MTGTVDCVIDLEFGPRCGEFKYAFACGDDGRRYFLHASACVGSVPRRFDKVEFRVDESSDPRGPVGVHVRIIKAAPPIDVGSLHDRELACDECHRPFIWSVNQQVRYRDRHWPAPKACSACRPIVRARHASTDERRNVSAGRGQE